MKLSPVPDEQTAKTKAQLLVEGATEMECSKCFVIKSVDEFPNDPRRKGGKYPWCLVCKRGYMKGRYTKRSGLYERDQRMTRRYGATYAELVSIYGDKCNICNAPEPEDGRLAVDHDHSTGKVRGLLCGPCNLGLGCYKDSTTRMQLAIEYLEKRRRLIP